MNVQGKQGVFLKPSLLFTRRVYQLTVDTLLPFRLAWTPTLDGFTVTLLATHDSGTTSPVAVTLCRLPVPSAANDTSFAVLAVNNGGRPCSGAVSAFSAGPAPDSTTSA
jgi:hypothetical protein